MTPTPIEKLIDHIATLATAEADALGFIPRQAYHEAAAQGRLHVATADGEPMNFCLLGAKKPHRRVYQAWTAPDHRRQGRQVALFETATEHDHETGILDHVAHVAEDLDAVLYWQAIGFRPVGQVDRATTRGRKVLVMVRPTAAAAEYMTWRKNLPDLDTRRKIAAMAGCLDAFEEHLYAQWITSR